MSHKRLSLLTFTAPVSRRAYVLVVDEASPRAVFTRRILTDIGFDVSMVRCTPDADKVLSNRLSMQQIYRTILESADDWAYVFEDDINTLATIRLDEIVEYEAISAKYFYLGVCLDTDSRIFRRNGKSVRGHNVVAVSNCAGLHAIGICKEGATALLKASSAAGSSPYMDRVLGQYSIKHSANVVRFDLKSRCFGHRGVLFQDRDAFPSLISNSNKNAAAPKESTL